MARMTSDYGEKTLFGARWRVLGMNDVGIKVFLVFGNLPWHGIRPPMSTRPNHTIASEATRASNHQVIRRLTAMSRDMKSRSREIRAALKFDRHLSNDAAEMHVKFQSDTIIIASKSRSFERSRDLAIKRLKAYWIEALKNLFTHGINHKGQLM